MNVYELRSDAHHTRLNMHLSPVKLPLYILGGRCVFVELFHHHTHASLRLSGVRSRKEVQDPRLSIFSGVVLLG